MKGEACSFGAVGSGPVLDLNGETLTFAQTGGQQRGHGALPAAHDTAESFAVLSMYIRYIPWAAMPGLQSRFDAAFDGQDMCLRKPAGIESAQGSIAPPGFDKCSLFPVPCHGENRGCGPGKFGEARRQGRGARLVVFENTASLLGCGNNWDETNNLVPPAICRSWVP
jgi:hypothetical protein